jgi:hypothetical protein
MAGCVVLAQCSELAIASQQSIAKNSFVWQPFFSAGLSSVVPGSEQFEALQLAPKVIVSSQTI